MASTYSTDLRLELIGSGEQSGVWGSTTNLNLGSLVEQAVAGVETIAISSSNQALTAFFGAVDQSRNAVLVLSSGAAANVYVPPVSKVYVVKNTGSFAITMFNSTVLGNTTAAGTGLSVAAGSTVSMFTDGVNFSAAGIPTGVSTGTGNVVFSASPTFTGVPLAPTANAGTNTTQISTTAFVNSAVTTATASLGTMATQNANAVAITGGTISGITDLAIADGGTGASTAESAFTNLKQAASDTATGVVELATVAEVQTGTDTTRAITPAGFNGASLGYGQTWTDVTGSRVSNTTYTNSTGKPIVVNISANASGQPSPYSIEGYVGAVKVARATTGFDETFISFIVPNGSTYRAVGGIFIWAELR